MSHFCQLQLILGNTIAGYIIPMLDVLLMIITADWRDAQTGTLLHKPGLWGYKAPCDQSSDQWDCGK